MTKTAQQTKIGAAAKRAAVKYRAYKKSNPNGTKQWKTFISEEHSGKSKKTKRKKKRKTKK